MALTVQTNSSTVVVGADSYISLADAESYFTDRGSPSGWTGTDPVKEAALRYAADWLDRQYEWSGSESTITADQERRAFPRLDCYDHEGRHWTGVPPAIARAQCEVALLHLSESLAAAPARGGRIKRKKVDVLETEYMDGAPAKRDMSFIHAMVAPWGRYRGGAIKLRKGA